MEPMEALCVCKDPSGKQKGAVPGRSERERGVKDILISQEEIQRKTAEAGAWVSQRYQGQKLLMVSILKGAFVFMADLMREVSIPCQIDFMCVSSYRSGTVSGKLSVLKDLDCDIRDFHVLIVEDIIDSGNTLAAVRKLLLDREPLSLSICALLDKPERRQTPVDADYVCFTIPDEFVVGYGLDCAEEYRNLPYIGVCGAAG